MNKLLIVFLILLSTSAYADQYVNGYIRNNGTYVQPYHRTTSDNNPNNNYSTKGNVNPYTGQPGAVNTYQQQQQQPAPVHRNTYRPYNPYRGN